MVPSPHFDVAAYALGVLDQEDHEGSSATSWRARSARSSLRELSEVPGFLDVVRRDRSKSLDDDRTPH